MSKKKTKLPTYVKKCKKCTCEFVEPKIIKVTKDTIIRINYLGITESIPRDSYEETEESIRIYNEKLDKYLEGIN